MAVPVRRAYLSPPAPPGYLPRPPSEPCGCGSAIHTRCSPTSRCPRLRGRRLPCRRAAPAALPPPRTRLSRCHRPRPLACRCSRSLVVLGSPRDPQREAELLPDPAAACPGGPSSAVSGGPLGECSHVRLGPSHRRFDLLLCPHSPHRRRPSAGSRPTATRQPTSTGNADSRPTALFSTSPATLRCPCRLARRPPTGYPSACCSLAGTATTGGFSRRLRNWNTPVTGGIATPQSGGRSTPLT